MQSASQAYAPVPLAQADDSPYDPYSQGQPSPSLNFHTPLANDNQPLPEEADLGAQPRFLGHAAVDSDLRHSVTPSQTDSTFTSDQARYTDNPNDSSIAMGVLGKEVSSVESPTPPPPNRRKRKIIIAAILAAAILLLIIILVPVYLTVLKSKSGNSEGSNDAGGDSNDGSEDAGETPVSAIVSGGNGTEIEMEDGTKFTYRNRFGGYWYWDENDVFNNGARAQSWSPALNETFTAGVDKIRGVNIGGWLVLEPFICPQMFEPHLGKTPVVEDEFTLHSVISAAELEEHYKTFITERDFAEIAGAGLNYVRIPLPYWAVEKFPDEPFHEKIAWKYFLKAIQWSRKYGLRINLDLHTIPGSQNAWDHSGKYGSVNWLRGPMGIANGQRSLDVIRVIAQFISQPQYRDVVTMFGIVNEPRETFVSRRMLEIFYYEAYKIIRNAGGTGEGQGPWISLHDGFIPLSQWASFLPNADRLSLDMHPYMAFNDQRNLPMSEFVREPCTRWASNFNTSTMAFGLTNAGEFSNGVNDCGLWLTGVNQGTRYEGTYERESQHTGVGDCSTWTDWQNYTPKTKADIRRFALNSMDALQDYFFWTWKIGASIRTGKVETPSWSYKLGLDNGWMPRDPRDAVGSCGYTDPVTLPSTGISHGPSNGVIPSGETSGLTWPPTRITGYDTPVSRLPIYTPTGAIPTLPGPTFSLPSATATPDVGTGWNNPADTTGMMRPIAGCAYLDHWVGDDGVPPPVCR